MSVTLYLAADKKNNIIGAYLDKAKAKEVHQGDYFLNPQTVNYVRGDLKGVKEVYFLLVEGCGTKDRMEIFKTMNLLFHQTYNAVYNTSGISTLEIESDSAEYMMYMQFLVQSFLKLHKQKHKQQHISELVTVGIVPIIK